MWATKAQLTCNIFIRVNYEKNKYVKHEVFFVSCFDAQ